MNVPFRQTEYERRTEGQDHQEQGRTSANGLSSLQINDTNSTDTDMLQGKGRGEIEQGKHEHSQVFVIP